MSATRNIINRNNMQEEEDKKIDWNNLLFLEVWEECLLQKLKPSWSKKDTIDKIVKYEEESEVDEDDKESITSL